MDFTEAEQRRTMLSDQMARGQITREEFIASINALRVTDSAGRTWQPAPSPAGWLWWNGTAWTTGTPQTDKVKAPAKDLMSIDEFKKISKDTPLAQRPQRWWDLLSILGGVAAAIIWFLYGGLREGFDIVSAVLMVVMPTALVLFRPAIDKTLLPIQPTRKKFHRVLLIGLGIASPFLTAWILYNIFHISQYPLMQANIIIGTLVSYSLVRDPPPDAGFQTRQKPVTAAGVSIIFCILVLSALAVPVMADDCTRDPLNAQDCLRTNGFAEVMAGLVAAILAGLINGPTILQTFLQNAATSASPAAQSVIN